MTIVYQQESSFNLDEMLALYRASGINRPTDDGARMAIMLASSNLLITARQNGQLLGLARCLTDKAYVVYICDLLVDKAYQQMIVESGTSDIVYTAAVSGVAANFMKKSLENAGIPPEMWSRAGKIDFGKELDAAQAEAKAWKTIWSAGQGVAAIQDVLPVADLVNQLKTDFRQSIEAQIELLQKYK